MVIGIDARFYAEAGPGRYIKNVISHLEKIDKNNTYKIFLRQKNFDKYNPQNPNFIKVLADFHWYTWEEQLIYPMQLLIHKLDLLYVPHFNVPILYPGKMVTVIHDIIMHSFSTEEATTLPKFYYKFKKAIYYLVVLLAIIKSKKIIVPSLATKDDILNYYKNVNPDKFVLAYEGVDPDLVSYDSGAPDNVLSKYNITKPYILYISSMYKHKNVERLIQAFKILQTKCNYLGQLVLVGKKDAFSNQIEALVHSNNLESHILMPGQKNYISDAEVSMLKKNALLYVFPSLKEGFSLTPLEAMASGLAVVTSNIPCHLEILGDSAEFFDPLLIEDIAEKLCKVINDNQLKEELIQKGYKQVQKYSFEETAQVTLDVFNNILKKA